LSLLGIDVGTGGAKAVAFNHEGEALASAYHDYHFSSPDPGCYELDAEVVWRAVASVIRRVNAEAEVKNDPVTALSVSVSGDEFVLVDREGRCLHPVILSMDRRGREEVEWLAERLGRERVYGVTGLPLSRKYGLCRMLWYRRNRPDLWERTWKCLTWEEFIHLRLGVNPVSDLSAVARLMVMDINSGRLATDVLAAAGVDTGLIAKSVPSGTAIGTLPRSVAANLGFRGPVTLVTGGFDQAMACLGAAWAEVGDAVVGTGTMESLCVVAERPLTVPGLMKAGYPWGVHVSPGLYISTATNPGGGLLLRWYRDTLGQDAVAKAKASGRNAYDMIVDETPVEPTELLLLPHFAGSGPPYRDGDSLGALVGLQPRTSRGEIILAILEGITYELLQNIAHFRDAGVSIKRLTAVGGGAQSDRWLQLKADVTGLPVRRPRVAEAGCLAAAILAGVATGVYRSVPEAARAVIAFEKSFEPDMDRHAAYSARYELYVRLYPALKDILHALRHL